MDFEEKFKQFLASFNPLQTDWSFVTSANGALAVKTPIVNVGANATGGAIWIKNESSGATHSLKYGGVGASVGVSAIPTPVDFAFSLPQMPSAGKIYKLPFAGRSLSLREMKGIFVMLDISGDVGPGGSGSAIFLGGSYLASAVAGIASAGALQIPALLATCNAAVLFGGMTVSVIPANASVTLYIGAVG